MLSDPSKSRSFTTLAHKTAAVLGAKTPLPLPFKSSNVSNLTLIDGSSDRSPILGFVLPRKWLTQRRNQLVTSNVTG